MRLSTQGSMAAAMAASLVSAATSASPVDLDLPKSLDLSKPINAGLSLDVDISHTALLVGAVAQATVGDIAAVGADVNVAVICQDCYVKGAVNASLSLENVVPALRLDLSDIEVKLDLDVHLDAGVTVAVRLPIPETHLSLPLPELDVGVSLYLELLVGAKTAIDVSAGVFVQLLQDAFLETNILDGKILDAAFDGLAVNVLPIEVRIGCTELLVDLKLRAEVAVKAEVELDEILPLEQLGLDIIPDIGAGIEVAAAVDLLEYVGLFCADASCPLGYESSGLSIAAAAKVNVEVEDVLDIPIELNIGTKLLSLPTATICSPAYPTGAVPTLPGSGSGYPVGGTTSGNSPATTPAPSGYTTTVVTGTQTFTATVCGERSANCPGGEGTTIVHTTVYTTTCPVGQTSPITGLPPAPTHETTPPVTITKHVTTMVPCSEVTTYVPPGSTPVVSVPPTAPVVSTTPLVSVPPTAPVVSTTAKTSPVQSTSVTVPATAPSFTPKTSTATVPEVPSFPVGTPPASTESCSTTETTPIVSVPTTAPVFSTSTVPVVSVPPTAPVVSTTAQTSPVQSTSVTVPSKPTTSVPVEVPSYPAQGPSTTPVVSVPTTAPVFSTSTVPKEVTSTHPVESTTVPVVPVEAPSYSAVQQPPVSSYPVRSPAVAYPAGSPPPAETTESAPPSYPETPATPQVSVPTTAPVVSSSSSVPVVSVPTTAPVVSTTAQTSPVGSTTVGTPAVSTSVPYPTGPAYPTGPSNPTGSFPSTFSSAPSVSLTYPTSSAPVGYPTHTPVQVAGAGKMTTGAAGVVAAVMAMAALM